MATSDVSFRHSGLSRTAAQAAVMSLSRERMRAQEAESAGTLKKASAATAVLVKGNDQGNVTSQGANSRANDDVGMRFGRRLRMLRKERSLTQSQMADAFGIDRSYISDVERGAKGVSLATLEVFALGFAMNLSELVSDL
ncbi:helix-turn-helix domain-containing protein [Acidipila sp. EB88]|uniref:helix-turn-helix domain-containing protein n=1 Tax=Acidipila sp. EB88 TaxID=2305226 RepID=UPI0018F27A2A|nr:helix-turn-helix transcriptional regulator [Acidipila sp. EB88]